MIVERKGYKWEAHEKQFIRDNFMQMTDKELADELKRPYTSVCNLRTKLKLSRFVWDKMIIKHGLDEAKRVKAMEKVLIEMKRLIFICENQPNNYKRDIAKKRLLKLSMLNRIY
jgi:hypothetical protein